MFKRIVGCLLLIMATANIAETIDGDLDLDGFFLLNPQLRQALNNLHSL